MTKKVFKVVYDSIRRIELDCPESNGKEWEKFKQKVDEFVKEINLND